MQARWSWVSATLVESVLLRLRGRFLVRSLSHCKTQPVWFPLIFLRVTDVQGYRRTCCLYRIGMCPTGWDSPVPRKCHMLEERKQVLISAWHKVSGRFPVAVYGSRGGIHIWDQCWTRVPCLKSSACAVPVQRVLGFKCWEFLAPLDPLTRKNWELFP